MIQVKYWVDLLEKTVMKHHDVGQDIVENTTQAHRARSDKVKIALSKPLIQIKLKLRIVDSFYVVPN